MANGGKSLSGLARLEATRRRPVKLALRTAIEREPAKLKSRLSEIIVLSNGEREALGFLPNAAYGDAIAQKRLFAILADNEDGESAVVGYICMAAYFLTLVSSRFAPSRTGVGTRSLPH